MPNSIETGLDGGLLVCAIYNLDELLCMGFFFATSSVQDIRKTHRKSQTENMSEKGEGYWDVSVISFMPSRFG